MTLVANNPEDVRQPGRPSVNRAELTPDGQTDEVDTYLEDVPRRIGSVSLDQVASTAGAFFGALALTWILYSQILPFSGTIGFCILWWVLYLALYVAVSGLSNPGPVVRSRLAAAVMTSGALTVFAALAATLGYIILQGWPALHHLNFYTHDMAGVSPTAPLTEGGISHALVGSAVQIAIATAIALPLGIGTAIYLTEIGGRAAVVVRTVTEAMTALPDILAGLFVYVVLLINLGMSRVGLAAAIALAVTMLPTIARSAEVTLRVVPSGLREASLALGASRWRTVWTVVLPSARSGLATALILGVARITGETAPLLIVSGSSTFFNANPLSEPMNSLPLFTFAGIKSGETLAIQRAYGAAVVLLLFVLILFVLTRLLARKRMGNR